MLTEKLDLSRFVHYGSQRLPQRSANHGQQPNEIYNLAGHSSIGLPFEQPVETLESISVGTLNLLEATCFLARLQLCWTGLA